MRCLPVCLTFATAALLSTADARARDICTGDGPQRPATEIQAAYEDDGYTVKSLELRDGCYEIRGTDAAGRKVDLYISPWTGETVKSKTN